MKNSRQEKIRDLISRYEIETQEELAQYLEREGFRVTQATVSRDIRELNLTKISSGSGKMKYAVVAAAAHRMNEKYLRVLRDGFVRMDRSGTMLVIRTVSGMAMAVAAAVDAMSFPEIAGCIAGDDTIFCALHSEAETAELMAKLRKLLTVSQESES